MRLGTPNGCYEEVREGQRIPKGSRSQLGTLIGVGTGLCGLPRILPAEYANYCRGVIGDSAGIATAKPLPERRPARGRDFP
jgi:hypothetical protein